MNYTTINHILDIAIVYTEAMFFYVTFACLILHIDKWLDKYDTQPTQPQLTGTTTKLLPPVIDHNIVPFTRKQTHSSKSNTYWSTMTCKQMRSYLKGLGYTKLSRLSKSELIEICEVA